MRKSNRKYAKKTINPAFKNKLLAMFNPNAGNILDKELILRFESKFRGINQRLEQGTANTQDIMCINGTLGTIDVLMRKSDFVDDIERFELVLFIKDKIKAMIDRIEKGALNIGYKNDDELKAVAGLYNIAHDIFSNRGLTNKQYDDTIKILEAECSLKNIKVY